MCVSLVHEKPFCCCFGTLTCVRSDHCPSFQVLMHTQPHCVYILFSSVFARFELSRSLDHAFANVYVGASVASHGTETCFGAHAAQNAAANAGPASNSEIHDAAIRLNHSFSPSCHTWCATLGAFAGHFVKLWSCVSGTCMQSVSKQLCMSNRS